MNFIHQHTFKEHKGPVYALCAAEASGFFYSAGSDRRVILWNLNEKKAEKVIAQAPTTIISLLYLEKFNYLLIGQVEGGLHVIDLEQGKEIKYLKQHEGYIFDIAFIESKNELILASGDGSVSVWSLLDFSLLWKKKLGKQKLREVEYNSSRQELAVASGEGKVILLNSEDWSTKAIIEDFTSSVNVLRYHPTENTLLAGEKDAQLHQIDLSSMKSIQKLPAHYWAIYDIAFSPNGMYFATASRDKTVKIWDAENYVVLKRFEGQKYKAHSHSVNKLLWLNQKQLLSTGDDGSIRLWGID
jgi:WD40 repeat protein